MVRAAARYRDELHHSREELKGATKVVTRCRQSILALENEKEYTDLERDWAKATSKRQRPLFRRRTRPCKLLLGNRMP